MQWRVACCLAGLLLSLGCLAPPPPAGAVWQPVQGSPAALSQSLLSTVAAELNDSARNLVLTHTTAESITATAREMDSVADKLRDVADQLDDNCCNGQPYRDEARKLEESARDAREKAKNLSLSAKIAATNLPELAKAPHLEGILIDGRGMIWHYYNLTQTLYSTAQRVLSEKQAELAEGRAKLQEARNLLNSCSCESEDDSDSDWEEAVEIGGW